MKCCLKPLIPSRNEIRHPASQDVQEIPLTPALSPPERFHRPHKAANCAPEPAKTELGRVSVLDCASPLALGKSWVVESARGLAHSKTLRWYERFMGSLDFQRWTRLGAMNRALPNFDPRGTKFCSRSRHRFMESLQSQNRARMGTMNPRRLEFTLQRVPEQPEGWTPNHRFMERAGVRVCYILWTDYSELS